MQQSSEVPHTVGELVSEGGINVGDADGGTSDGDGDGGMNDVDALFDTDGVRAADAVPRPVSLASAANPVNDTLSSLLNTKDR